MLRRPAASYDVIRLHSHSDNAWAVIEVPSGAIALDGQARPLMRLLQRDALQMAETLTVAAMPTLLLDPASGS